MNVFYYYYLLGLNIRKMLTDVQCKKHEIHAFVDGCGTLNFNLCYDSQCLPAYSNVKVPLGVLFVIHSLAWLEHTFTKNEWHRYKQQRAAQ